jgi:hypothetical protein
MAAKAEAVTTYLPRLVFSLQAQPGPLTLSLLERELVGIGTSVLKT